MTLDIHHLRGDDKFGSEDNTGSALDPWRATGYYDCDSSDPSYDGESKVDGTSGNGQRWCLGKHSLTARIRSFLMMAIFHLVRLGAQYDCYRPSIPNGMASWIDFLACFTSCVEYH